MRFFLHAIPENVQADLMKAIDTHARPGDFLVAEFRTDKDEPNPRCTPSTTGGSRTPRSSATPWPATASRSRTSRRAPDCRRTRARTRSSAASSRPSDESLVECRGAVRNASPVGPDCPPAHEAAGDVAHRRAAQGTQGVAALAGQARARSGPGAEGAKAAQAAAAKPAAKPVPLGKVTDFRRGAMEGWVTLPEGVESVPVVLRLGDVDVMRTVATPSPHAKPGDRTGVFRFQTRGLWQFAGAG